LAGLVDGYSQVGTIFTGPAPRTSDLVVIDGPNMVRSLGETSLVAVSPDGERALITHDRIRYSTVQVIRLADGDVLAEQDFFPGSGFNTPGRGVWIGDRVFVTNGVLGAGTNHPRPRIVVLSLARGRITVEHIYSFNRHEGSGPFANVGSLMALDAAGTRIAFWWGPPDARYGECDLSTKQCIWSTPYPARVGFVSVTN
jgi:hypothetical protein